MRGALIAAPAGSVQDAAAGVTDRTLGAAELAAKRTIGSRMLRNIAARQLTTTPLPLWLPLEQRVKHAVGGRPEDVAGRMGPADIAVVQAAEQGFAESEHQALARVTTAGRKGRWPCWASEHRSQALNVIATSECSGCSDRRCGCEPQSVHTVALLGSPSIRCWRLPPSSQESSRPIFNALAPICLLPDNSSFRILNMPLWQMGTLLAHFEKVPCVVRHPLLPPWNSNAGERPCPHSRWLLFM